MALAALDLEHEPHKVARIFDHHVRSVCRWKERRCAAAYRAGLRRTAGRPHPQRGVKYLLRRIGRCRDDGNRYTPKVTSSSSGIDRTSS